MGGEGVCVMCGGEGVRVMCRGEVVCVWGLRVCV